MTVNERRENDVNSQPRFVRALCGLCLVMAFLVSGQVAYSQAAAPSSPATDQKSSEPIPGLEQLTPYQRSSWCARHRLGLPGKVSRRRSAAAAPPAPVKPALCSWEIPSPKAGGKGSCNISGSRRILSGQALCQSRHRRTDHATNAGAISSGRHRSETESSGVAGGHQRSR